MDLGVDRERSPVHDVVALDDLAVVVHEQQVGHADHAEVPAEGVDPEVVEKLGVTSGDVPRRSLVVAQLRPEPERRGQALLAMQALRLDRGLGRGLTGVRLLHERRVYG